MKFALFFGNRGFFPESLIAYAREEIAKAVTDAGHEYLIMDEGATRYGAVETREEGRIYAKWLADHRGEYDGVILSLPNFGDENGAVIALQDCGVPILIQAYPDEIGKMDFARRRDAYCGKLSVEDVFYQFRLPFTVLEPHVVHPDTDTFQKNLRDFAATCRVANGMKRFTVGALGARTTAFKTVRYDEITLQKYGITVECFDLSSVIAKVTKLASSDKSVTEREERLRSLAICDGVPAEKLDALSKLSVVMDEYIEEFRFDCLTLRCWTELQEILGIAPCMLIGELNERGMPAACEIDLCSAINMYSLKLATGAPAACLDWNNNYGDDLDKVVLFHCGPVAPSLMAGKGNVGEHKMFAKTAPGSGWGVNEGRIKPCDMTYTSCKTDGGLLSLYVDEGVMTGDPIEAEYFGCAGVAKIDNLQQKLIKLGRCGFRHHTTTGVGHYAAAMKEAFTTYLGYDLIEL